MDDVIVRPRYPRQNVPNRRRKKNYREENIFGQKVLRQVFLSLVIFGLIWGVKSINTPVTNFLAEKIHAAFAQNIEIKGLYEKVDNWFASLFSKEAETKGSNEKTYGEEDTPEESVASDPGLSGQESDLQNTSQITDTEGENQDPQVPAVQEGEAESDVSAAGEVSDSEINEIMKKYSFIAPVGGYLGSPYGDRVNPLQNTPEFHKGVDIEANKGTSIKAALGGTVLAAGSDPQLGNYVKIDHGDGLETTYAHCSVLLIKKAQKVKQGDIIAKVGDTGASLGAHLHFEIRKNAKAIDPQKFINIPVKPKTSQG